MTIDIHTASANYSVTDAHDRVRLVAWQHRYLAAIIIVYNLAALATASLYNSGVAVLLLNSKIESFSITVFLIICVMAWSRPGWLVRFIPADEQDKCLPSKRILNGLFTIILLPVFFNSYSAFKKLIPAINPFRWDEAFAIWDANLHGGIDPWRLLQPLLGHPVVTVAVDWFYIFWFVVVFGTLFWQAFSVENAERRMRFLLSFVLSWIVIGTIAATLFSSAGPVYFAELTGSEFRFADLLAYLHSVDRQYPIMAVEAQELLWQTYQSGEATLVNGVSAMPSIHVAAAFLTVLLFWQSGLIARIALTLFATMILLGSVHLAWHYAIDGYVAAAVVFAIWKAAAHLARHSLAHK